MSIFRHYVAESVSDGHPDKIADQVSDAIVDALLEQNPQARVAVETLIKDHTVVLAGEISAQFDAVDWDALVRDVLLRIGHADGRWGLDLNKLNIMTLFSQQSSDIAHGVDREKMGAGDQGMMYGYACNHTPEYMPQAIAFAHRIMRQHKLFRQQNMVIGPDAKCQVSLRYENNDCVIDNIVFSTQHSEGLSLTALEEMVVEMIVKPCVPSEMIRDARFIVNPSGPFIQGGPIADCGVTGRKIIVDTYGSAIAHGGGAFSGKDPTKVDRSAAYMARYIAKHAVVSGLASEVMVILAYAIGSSEPVLIKMYSDVGDLGDAYIREHFDASPQGIINTLDLNRPIYRQTASFGHFGRQDLDLPWERVD